MFVRFVCKKRNQSDTAVCVCVCVFNLFVFKMSVLWIRLSFLHFRVCAHGNCVRVCVDLFK